MDPISVLEPATATDGCQLPDHAKGPHRGPLRLVQPLRAGRIAVWSGASVIVVTALAMREPFGVAACILGLTVCLASALAPDSRPGGVGVVALLPGSFILLCALVTSAGIVAGLLRYPIWASGMSYWVLLGVIIGSGVVVVRRRGAVVIAGRDAPALVAFAALALVYVLALAKQPLASWSRSMGSGTDFLRHLGMVRDLRELGYLPPATGYPRSLHSLLSNVTAAMGLDNDASSLWRSAGPTTFLLLGLMLVGVAVAAGRVAASLSSSWGVSMTAGALAAFAFVQTAWFSAFLMFGGIMNMVVGICLLAVLISSLHLDGSTRLAGVAVTSAALAVTANAWPLVLPVIGMYALPVILASLRAGQGRALTWLMWLAGLALALNGLLALGIRSTGTLAVSVSTGGSVATVSNLFTPGWWWWAALLATLTSVVFGIRRCRAAWAWSALCGLVASVILMWWLLRSTGSTWDLMLYYPVKVLWTALLSLVPLGGASLVWLTWLAWTYSARTRIAAAGTGAVILVLGVVTIGFLGRASAFPPHLVQFAEGRSGMPNWALAVTQAVASLPVDPESEAGTIIFGIVPASDVSGVRSGMVGMADYMAMEALEFTGIEGAAGAPVKGGLYQRDMTQICRYLKEHPRSLRLTGPNPEAGAPWIIASGCPTDIVRPDRWVSLRIDDAWFEGTLWEGGTWSFPTFEEVQPG